MGENNTIEEAYMRSRNMAGRTGRYINNGQSPVRFEENRSAPVQNNRNASAPHGTAAQSNGNAGNVRNTGADDIMRTLFGGSGRQTGMPNTGGNGQSCGNPMQSNGRGGYNQASGGCTADSLTDENRNYSAAADTKQGGAAGLLDGILANLKIDEDKVLIIFLLIILARNGSDIKLLIALGYLLM